MKTIVKTVSLVALLCAASSNVFAEGYRSRGFQCGGQTDDGKSFSIGSSFDALESSPPIDTVSVTIEGKKYGGWGHHGFAYAPGLRVLRESLTDKDRILLSFPDAHGKVEIDIQLTGEYKLPNNLHASGISCEDLVPQDFGNLDSLTLKKEKPFETLAQDALADGYEETLSRVYSILTNLIEPTSDVALTFRGLFLNNTRNLKGRFNYDRSGWNMLLSLMLETESIQTSEKVELAVQFYKDHPEAASQIALILFKDWWDIVRDVSSAQNLFLQLSPQLETILASKDSKSHDYVSRVIIPNTLGALPERLNAINLLFNTVEIDNDLAELLGPIDRDLRPGEFEDFMKNVAPRLLKAPTFGPETIDTLRGLAEKQNDPEHRKAVLNLIPSNDLNQ